MENRRDRNHSPRPGMHWSEKYQMWLDPDTRSPEKKKRDEEIVADIERRAKEGTLWPKGLK